jgi:hypothetical protein
MSSRREQIREVLALLASEDQQLAYERDVPHVDITVELVEVWFSDLFHGTNPGKWLEDRTLAESELAAISEFHRFYSERMPQLPISGGTVRTWLTSPVWRDVMTQAEKTLDSIPSERSA